MGKDSKTSIRSRKQRNEGTTPKADLRNKEGEGRITKPRKKKGVL